MTSVCKRKTAYQNIRRNKNFRARVREKKTTFRIGKNVRGNRFISFKDSTFFYVSLSFLAAPLVFPLKDFVCLRVTYATGDEFRCIPVCRFFFLLSREVFTASSPSSILLFFFFFSLSAIRYSRWSGECKWECLNKLGYLL